MRLDVSPAIGASHQLNEHWAEGPCLEGNRPRRRKAFGAHCAADSSLLTLVARLNRPRRCLAFVPGQVSDADPQV
jgi:hypothetical protein